MPYGYDGKVLRVNLTDSTIQVEEPDDLFYRTYLGGMGFIAYYLLKELKPGADPLGHENKLIFAAGPVTGAPIAGSGRNSVGAKSPQTGGIGKSEVGGFWGAELKRAGFDAIIVEGAASTPVYLWVHDGQAEIRDATHLWGRTTKEVQGALREELGDPLIRTAQIGPAGENLVRFACVINDLRGAAGRTGMGAVMGSKKLKAIAVRGRTPVDVADPDKVRALARWMAANYYQLVPAFHDLGTGAGMAGGNLMGNLPTRNFRDGDFPEVDRISAETVRDTIRVKMVGCYACPVRCKKVVEAKEPYEADPDYGGPEYETLAAFGSNCGIDNVLAIARAHHLCNAYGVDTISAGGTIAFAMECLENGLLSQEDTGGIDLRFGNAEAMLKVLELIVHREGIGRILAEGSRRAADIIGNGASRYAMEVKGVELGMHEPRVKPGLGVGYAVANHGGDHGTGAHDPVFEKEGRQLDGVKAIGILEPIPRYELSARKMTLFTRTHLWSCTYDSLVMCKFLPWSYQQTAEVVAAVTGWSTSVYDLMLAGERAVTLGRIFNVREGLSVAEDHLPERFFAPTTMGTLQQEGRSLDREEFARARRFYYQFMGWDPGTAVPTENKLGELGIGWAAAELRVPGQP